MAIVAGAASRGEGEAACSRLERSRSPLTAVAGRVAPHALLLHTDEAPCRTATGSFAYGGHAHVRQAARSTFRGKRMRRAARKEKAKGRRGQVART